jgi:hypothetical protein
MPLGLISFRLRSGRCGAAISITMKKPSRIDDSVEDMEWERARRVLSTRVTPEEASDILEEDPTAFYRRSRKAETNRPKQEKVRRAEDHEENHGH